MAESQDRPRRAPRAPEAVGDAAVPLPARRDALEGGSRGVQEAQEGRRAHQEPHVRRAWQERQAQRRRRVQPRHHRLRQVPALRLGVEGR